MGNLYTFMASRNNDYAPANPIPRRNGEVMQQQIDGMISENERFSKAISYLPRRESLVSRGWLEDACATIPNGMPISKSTPELGYSNVTQINYLADPDKLKLSNALARAAIDICRLSRKRTDMLPVVPNRILITAQGTAVVVRFHGQELRQLEISRRIERYIHKFCSLQHKGHPLLSNKIPKRAIAIRWDGTGGIKFKRVRYLETIKNYDYFLEYETGTILELRFDLTRFFYLPDSFDRDFSALLACSVDYHEPSYDDMYMQMGLFNRRRGRAFIRPIVIGKEPAEDGPKCILDRFPTFKENSQHPIRRVKSEESLDVLNR